MNETTKAPPPPPQPRLSVRLQEAARVMEQHFLDKQEIVRLMLITVVAGEHMLLIGPPGTAKSAMVRTFAKLVDARYFDYLLTRFTEPNELFGPVDIKAFREGTYTRKTDAMLPEAEIVFLDEIFRSNSAILNSLLTLLNERRFSNGARMMEVPLLSMFGASNEVPNDDNLSAIFDRFLIRAVSDNLDSYHFHNLVTKGLVFQIRSEGISISDRRVVKLLKLFAASAIVDGREQPNDSDFFLLKHIWNNLDQTEILEEIVGPVVDRWYRDHPQERRFSGGQAGLDELLAELGMIRELLTSGEQLSDIQLFSQLKNLNEIKAALQAVDSETARRMVGEVDQLLENVFASSKFG